MKKMFLGLIIVSAAVLLSCSRSVLTERGSVGGLAAVELRCEDRTEPLGIGQRRPRLGWVLQSERRGEVQTAYQIQAATQKELLISGRADLWDSGKVESGQTFDIVYAGKELESGMDCWWRVRVWDGDGNTSAWSLPARWSMGLLAPSDWRGQWIGLDIQASPAPVPAVFQKARWIWSVPSAAQGVKPGRCFFRKTFELPAGWAVKSAWMWMTADDSFQSFLNGKILRSFAGHQQVYEICIRDYLTSGRNVLAVTAVNDGREPSPAGLLAVVRIETVDGRLLEFVTDETWKVTESPVDDWQSPSLDDGGWEAASAAASFGSAPWVQTRPQVRTLPAARYLRRGFSLLSKPIARARLYASALGVYQVYLNGQRISQEVLSPGWTDYRKRV